jgi:hypothetical protein
MKHILAILFITCALLTEAQGATGTANVGQAVTFSVTVDGTPPFTYQWQKGGTLIAGATASTLQLKPVSASDAATYSVVVSNSAGSCTSDNAVLTVNIPVAVSTPTSMSVPLGSPASFTVVASGTGPYTYQWKKNADLIVGATFATYSIPSTSLSDAGIYTCVVTGASGSITSPAATLTVSIIIPSGAKTTITVQ